MRKKLFFAAYAVAIFTSCTKKKDVVAPASYYVSFKINDSLINHTGLDVCSLRPNTTITGSYEFVFSSNTSKSGLTMSLFKPGAIGTGTYSIADPSLLSTEYTLDQGLTVYSLHTTNMPPAPFALTLSEINEVSIKGTFTGNYLYNDDRTDSIRISEGKFFVRRSR